MEHHECHAMSAVLTTDWEDCAVMDVDSVGGRYATSVGVYENNNINEYNFNSIFEDLI